MLLEDKNAVIYGGGGSVGGAIARAFACEGANVFLTGRTREPLDKVADEISATGESPRRRRSTLWTRKLSRSTPTPWPRRSEASTSPTTRYALLVINVPKLHTP